MCFLNVFALPLTASQCGHDDGRMVNFFTFLLLFLSRSWYHVTFQDAAVFYRGITRVRASPNLYDRIRQLVNLSFAPPLAWSFPSLLHFVQIRR